MMATVPIRLASGLSVASTVPVSLRIASCQCNNVRVSTWDPIKTLTNVRSRRFVPLNGSGRVDSLISAAYIGNTVWPWKYAMHDKERLGNQEDVIVGIEVSAYLKGCACALCWPVIWNWWPRVSLQFFQDPYIRQHLINTSTEIPHGLMTDGLDIAIVGWQILQSWPCYSGRHLSGTREKYLKWSYSCTKSVYLAKTYVWNWVSGHTFRYSVQWSL